MKHRQCERFGDEEEMACENHATVRVTDGDYNFNLCSECQEELSDKNYARNPVKIVRRF